jgi:hypothetical protein
MAGSSKNNLREYSRVDTFMSIEVRVVPPQDRHTMKWYIAGDSILPDYQVPGDVNDPVLAAWLKMLNAKLDAVITLLDRQNEKTPRIGRKKVNISGGGLSFDSSDKYKIHDLLEIRMELPVTLSSAIYVYGEVVDVRPRDDYYQTAVKFITIDEEIREQIIQFVVKSQPDIPRQKKG